VSVTVPAGATRPVAAGAWCGGDEEIEMEALPYRATYGLADGLPDGVQLARAAEPFSRDRISWTVCAAHPHWNHVAVMDVQWSEERGHWVALPDKQRKLIVTSTKGAGERHPELDGTLHPDAETAMRAAWDAGLLEVIVWPPRG
jgi:hypothetical protein